jgi:hypothetical protein
MMASYFRGLHHKQPVKIFARRLINIFPNAAITPEKKGKIK